MKTDIITVDGNEAAVRIAHKVNEIIIIYPITPASPMGEWADVYSAHGDKNLWGTVPDVTEMQSEAGAAGAVHGSLQTGSLTTTFTASQGLLLMLPNMYKIAGELTSTVFHVAARSIAAQGLSIFGDHTDVMSVRQSGFAMLVSNSVQEVHDFTLISQAATLKARVPFLHFFDGFRTSHEVKKIDAISDDVMRTMIDHDLIEAHRNRALSPEHPFIRGTAQNPDLYFQGRESVNTFYLETPAIVEDAMNQFAALTGRAYGLFDYVGDRDAERVIVLMGSGAETVHETVEYLQGKGEKIGVIKVRLFRPFSIAHFIAVLPESVTSIAVLDRTKEPGSVGEPLYQDILTALSEAHNEGSLRLKHFPKVIGGRYGLSSKEFTPAMVKRVFDELKQENQKQHFTIGIIDDVTHMSLEWDPDFIIENDATFRGVFYGLGSDGTVGANKNTIKIIGEETENEVQGYFVYDSKKSGSMTVSHLRISQLPIHSTYLIQKANFIACHQAVFLEKFDILLTAERGASFLLNSPHKKEEVWHRLPRRIQREIMEKELRFYVINAYSVAKEAGLHRRINTIMQTCFFTITSVMRHKDHSKRIKQAIEQTYGKQGEEVVRKNFAAVDITLENLYEITVPDKLDSDIEMLSPISGSVPDFVQNVTAKLIAGQGDTLPVSMVPADGTWPSGTTQYEKRNIAMEVPVWEPQLCIQCNKCVTVCPHSVIRGKVYDEALLEHAPETFKDIPAKGKMFEKAEHFTIQISVEDCTGCMLCVEECPAESKEVAGRKAINMMPIHPLLDAEKENWNFFSHIEEIDRSRLNHSKIKEAQLLEPLFEFSGACPGCGETPYIKLATQLFGDRMIVANATGCSSIYGGNLPTTPWSVNKEGRGPAWSNSLFEDNAEFGLGFRLSIDKQSIQARELLQAVGDTVPHDLVSKILSADQKDEAAIFEQRKRVDILKEKLKKVSHAKVNELLEVANYLVKKSVWMIGGDGWAYDIGYGGVDHVLDSGKNVNILVLDTQVYSNTGGQQSKATPTGAVAKFAANGKAALPKDLARMAMAYENVYVARVAMGASDSQTLKALMEAEQYDGPSLIIAYSHCIAHGYDLRFGMHQQRLAVECGLWPLFRYHPERAERGEHPLTLDYKKPKIPVSEYMKNEMRFSMVHRMDPEREAAFIQKAQKHADDMWEIYKNLSDF